jgi:hypothetical protein
LWESEGLRRVAQAEDRRAMIARDEADGEHRRGRIRAMSRVSKVSAGSGS